MKKLITAILIIVLILIMNLSAFAYNYNFESGVDYGETFGKPTSTDEPVSHNPMDENTRRNKDAAYMPPPYFYGSGDIPTDRWSLYHDNSSDVSYAPYNGGSGSSSTGMDYGMLPTTAVNSFDMLNTQPLYYTDGSIGTLEFPRFKKTIKVYEGETLENMRLGAGHFSNTSTWDGNCAVAAHNRGVPNNFSFIKDIQVGDKITYTTKYGVRTYEIISKTQITETDMSPLTWSENNILSLVTCVENKVGYRWYVTAKQINN